jgi:hypothetical protein
VGRASLTAAWLFGLGLISYRYISRDHQPPVPGTLLAASGLFALLALVAEYQPAAAPAALAGWGFDLAALMNILPGSLAGPAKGKAPAPPTTAQAAASAAGFSGTIQAPGTTTAGGRG